MCSDLSVGEAGREGVAEGGGGQVPRLSLWRRQGEIQDIVLTRRDTGHRLDKERYRTSSWQGEIQDIVLARKVRKG